MINECLCRSSYARMCFLLLICVVEEAQCLILLGEFAYSFFVLYSTLTEVHFHILQLTLLRRHMSAIRSICSQYIIPIVPAHVLLGTGLAMFYRGKGIPDPC